MSEQVVVTLDEIGLDDLAMDREVRAVRDQLLQLDVDSVQRPPGKQAAPHGSRGVDPTSLTTLVVSGATSAAFIGGVAQVVVAWIQRSSARTVEVSLGDRRLTLDGASKADVDAAVEAFLADSR